MTFIEKLLLWWKKAYLWVGLACVVILMVLLFWKRKAPGPSPTPKELEGLQKVAHEIKQSIAKADNEATVKIIKAEAKEEAVKAQVDQIQNSKELDELEKAKQLVALRKTQTGGKT